MQIRTAIAAIMRQQSQLTKPIEIEIELGVEVVAEVGGHPLENSLI